MNGHQIVRHALFCLTAVAPLCGCATTARIQLDRWHAVEFDVQGVDRLAVLRFAGKQEVADAVRAQVLSEVERGGFYTVVDEGTALRLGQDAAYLGTAEELKLAVAQAREAGIDALLAARLRGRAEDSGLAGGVFRTGIPAIVVELSYDLIHVPTGRILAQQSITRNYEGEYTDTNDVSTVTEEVARRLAMECGSALVAEITAHPESFEVSLASSAWPSGGAAQVSEGNEAAENGDWTKAIDHWHAALKETPENHAAMYNLGIAFERAADHEGAAHWYSKAVVQKDSERYQRALARVDQGREEFRLAQVQVARQRRGYFYPSVTPSSNTHGLLGQPTDTRSLGYR
jgi:tetratricopeptide (TPR) repeat protein